MYDYSEKHLTKIDIMKKSLCQQAQNESENERINKKSFSTKAESKEHCQE